MRPNLPAELLLVAVAEGGIVIIPGMQLVNIVLPLLIYTTCTHAHVSSTY